MLTFRTSYDLQKVDPRHPFNRILLNFFQQTEQLDGYLILIEEGDTTVNLPELKRELAQIRWEGVTKLEGFYYAVYLTNNEFALEFVIPDADWLRNDIRTNLERHR